MSLTKKLLLGFAFALLLQVIQMLVSGHFTERVLVVVQEIQRSTDTLLTAKNAGDSVAMLAARHEQMTSIDTLQAGLDGAAQYWNDLEVKCRILETNKQTATEWEQPRTTDDGDPDPIRSFRAYLTTGMADFAELSQIADGERTGTPEDLQDAAVLIGITLHDLQDTLSILQTRLTMHVRVNLEREQQIHNLPRQAAWIIITIGAIVLILFTLWYSQQLARPVEAARTALEQCVAERTEHLSSVIAQLKHEVVERKHAQEEREKLHAELVDASRAAGMAELATGVLHNIGNVLNSVNVSASLIRGQLRSSCLPRLSMIADIIASHADGDFAEYIRTDEKGKILPELTVKMVRRLGEERELLLDEVSGLNNRVDHIKDIVERQQACAKAAGVYQVTMLTDVIEDVVALQAESLREYGIEVVRDYDEIPEMGIDKARVMQIVMNLLANAKDAMTPTSTKGSVVTVSVKQHEECSVRISVGDQGMGITTENLTRVFSHGFTTKVAGHGFGLHHSANAATEMGGALSVESEGPGHGAVFHLDLPMAAACPV